MRNTWEGSGRHEDSSNLAGLISFGGVERGREKWAGKGMGETRQRGDGRQRAWEGPGPLDSQKVWSELLWGKELSLQV